MLSFSKKAVQHGIIIDIEGVICPTRLYDSALQRTRWRYAEPSCHANETALSSSARRAPRKSLTSIQLQLHPQAGTPDQPMCYNNTQDGTSYLDFSPDRRATTVSLINQLFDLVQLLA